MIPARSRHAVTLILMATLASTTWAQSLESTFQGTFSHDDEKRSFYFSLTQSTTVTLRTYSYAGGQTVGGTTIPGGGFDPTLSLFDVATGLLIANNRDGTCATVSTDPVSGACWDARLTVNLPAGSYQAVLTIGDNLADGPTLTDSSSGTPVYAFVYEGQGDYTTGPGGIGPPGLWDASGNKRTGNFTLGISGPSAVTAQLILSQQAPPSGQVGVAYTSQLTSTGGTAPVAYAAPANALPPGLTLASTGLLSGTPTLYGTYNFTVTATDSGATPATTTATYQVFIAPAPLTITTTSLTPWVSGTPFTQQLLAAGGVTPYTWSIPQGGNSASLTLSPGGQFTGTPTSGVEGTNTLNVQVQDSLGTITAKQIAWVVASPTVITTSQLPAGITAQPYSAFSFTSTGGAPNSTKTWSISAGTPPTGMSLSASGVLQGQPATKGSYSFTVRVDDGVQPVAKILQLNVFDPLVITTQGLPNGIQGTSYGPVNLTATGGSGTVTWLSTTLVPGTALSADGLINGSAGSAGTYSVTITARDTLAGQIQSKTFPVSISFPQLSISAIGDIGTAVGGAVSKIASAAGGKPPYTYSADGFPAGITINAATGAISGSSSTPGRFPFTVTATDAQGFTASTGATLSVLGLISTGPLSNASTVAAYSQTFAAAGGTPPYTFSAGGIPDGMVFGSGGVLAGTPKKPGTYNVTIQVSDATGANVSASFSLTVTAPPNLSVSSASLSSGTVGIPYSDTVAATGGTGSFVWSVAGGGLPDGLSLSGAGTLSGTPTKPGTFEFTARATDSSGGSATGAFTVQIAPPPLTLSLTSLPNGIVGVEYAQQVITPDGGVKPYTFAISGSLPAGLSFTSGQISGTPTLAGSSSFTITVSDASTPALSVSARLSITVNPNSQADLVLSASSAGFTLAANATGLPDSQAITVRSSVILQPLNFSVVMQPSVPWASVSGGGATPGTITVGLTSAASALTAATSSYTTTVVVNCLAPSPCAGKSQNIGVSLSISSPPPLLSVGASLLSFSASAASPTPSTQSFTLENKGGGSIGVKSVSASDGWVTLSGVPASVSAGVSANITVGANTSGLAAGYYRSTIQITTSVGSAALPVGLFLSRDVSMNLSPGGSQFQMQAGGAPGNASGSFLVSVNGSDPVGFSASVLPGAPWLSLETSSGSASNTAPGSVSFSIVADAAAALAPAAYYGTIRVTSAQVSNSPLDFSVILNVTPATDPVKPDPKPAGLIFISNGGSSVPSQTVAVYAGSKTAVPYQASAATDDGGGWLSVAPSTGSTSAAAPAQSSVGVNLTGLAPGIYRGGVSYAFSAAAVRTVNVTLIVQAGGAALLQTQFTSHAAGCTPTKLVPTQTGLTTNFSQPASWPTPLTIKLFDDCGNIITSGQVVTSFSNGDPPLPLQPIDKTTGLYAGTWTPRITSSQITITSRASATGFAAATSVIKGQVAPNSAPALNPGGTLNAFGASLGAPLGPGSIVQIYGTNLSAQPNTATALPLPDALGGTKVIIGGKNAPLYFASATQINAQVPVELKPNQQYQIVVSANGALSTPDTLQLTDVAPGIATFANGAVIAQHLDGSLVLDTKSPAKPGEIVIFYMSGLGVTDNQVPTGDASPGDILAHPTVPLKLTLNGVDAPVQFVGLTPGLVGLFQVNFKVPDAVPDGNLDLLIQQGDILSNKTILPVKK